MKVETVELRSETLEGYGMRSRATCQVARVHSVDDIAEMLVAARAAGATVGMRGGGCSYGDAALNGGHIVVDTSGMNRILAWNPDSGTITVEPGVTIAQLWRETLAAGWWPPVVPGTMAVTVGGAAAANIHGKNNWRDGCFGDHILTFDLLLASGQVVTCSRESQVDLFHAAIGGFGLLGVFTSITLRMRRIYSGRVHVRQTAHPSLKELVSALDAGTASATHLVAWVDTAARGTHLGRGLLKSMLEFQPGEDSDPAATLDPQRQPPPPRVAGVVPVEWIPTLARPIATRTGTRLANRAQWLRGNLPGADRAHDERYVPANFMLNFIPNFRYVYRPGGLIQHQSFIDAAHATALFSTILQEAQSARLEPSLAVLKKHQTSPFLLNYLPDGYSLALDFAVPHGQEHAVNRLMRDLNDLVANSGGTFFLAKDSTLKPAHLARAFAAGTLRAFRDIKQHYDPAELFQSDLYRRTLQPAMAAAAQ